MRRSDEERARLLAVSENAGDRLRALDVLDSALKRREAALPDDKLALTQLHLERAELLLERGEPSDGLVAARRAHEIFAEALPTTNPYRAHARIVVARAQVAAGRPVRGPAKELRAAVAALKDRAPAFADWGRADTAWLKRQ